MKRGLLAGLMLVLLAPLGAGANTWNEPWHREVVAQSDVLGLFEVESVEGRKAVVRLRKLLAGEGVPARLTISGYHLLRVTSASSGDWAPWLQPGQRHYLLLKKTGDGEWLLPTPSAGSDELRANGRVAATYRISMNKAQVPSEVYEATETCLFTALHGTPCDNPQALDFVARQLRAPVAPLLPGAEGEALERFYLQHAALETAALAALPVDDETLQRFLASPSVPVQMSALQVLASSDRADRLQRLSAFVCAEGSTAMARSMAVSLLDRQQATAEAATLRACAERLPDEPTELNVVSDPRIGTEFPASPRQGVRALLNKWALQKTAPADPLGALRGALRDP